MQVCSLTSYRTYRAPSENGEVLIAPLLHDAAATILSNQASSRRWDVNLAGTPLEELRRVARSELVRDALLYSRKYRDVNDTTSDGPIVMAGHQPTLFHPGVWFKNFALDRVAKIKSTGVAVSTAINLVIDNDVASCSAVRVPVIDSASGLVRQESIAFDSAAGGVPYEQNRIRDRGMFDSFDVRLKEAISPIVSEPLVTPLWKHARSAVARCENVSCAVAHARHSLEAELGLNTLELPLSVVCRSDAFAAFAISIISESGRFRDIYNEAIHEYRIHHGIRSKAHPVPELAAKDGWTEAPFWLYGDDSPQRKPLWIRATAASLELSDLDKKHVRLTSPADRSPAASELASHAGPHWKLRPRALVTTMYARMILSDLFIHGIGGATYDQLGDQIMQRFFGVKAPELMVVSATVHLPMAHLLPAGASVETVRQQLRNTRFAPESFAQEVDLPSPLLERKQQLLSEFPKPGEKLAWHQEMTSVNQSLSAELTQTKHRLESQLQLAKQAASSTAILKSREYSFCMFNLDRLRNKFEAMLQQ